MDASEARRDAARRAAATRKATQSPESWLDWAKRVTRSGEYNLSSFVDVATEATAEWLAADRAAGKDYVRAPWWGKCDGREQGSGRIPRTMAHKGKKIVFPIIERLSGGSKTTARVVRPTCPKCGSDMKRKTRHDGGIFFSCLSFPNCNGSCDAWPDVSGTLQEEAASVPADASKSVAGKGDADETPAVETPEVDETPSDEKLMREVVALITKAREVVEAHGMSLPIAYRQAKQLYKLARILGNSANAAWRLWIDGRVSPQEREKFDAAGLPSGAFNHGSSPDEAPATWHTVRKVLKAGLPVFFVGESGTGKTECAEWLAEMDDKELHTCVGSGDVAGNSLWVKRDLVSVKGKKGTVTKDRPGPAMLAATRGEYLFLDECDGFDANALLPLNSLLNGNRKFSIPNFGKVTVHESCRIIAAANTNGRSLDRTYAGRNRLDGAFLNRFAVVVRFTFEEDIALKIMRDVARDMDAEVTEED